MTIEDLNEACGYTPTSSPTRYAYYSYDSSVSGTITNEENGKIYTKKAHGYETTRFYTYDGGGVEATDSSGYTYRTPEENNPVYATYTYYNYTPSSYNHAENTSVTIGSLLGASYGWLASPCVILYSSYAGFNVRRADSSIVNAPSLAYSGGNSFNSSNGVRPLVFLSSELQAIAGDGTSESPWILSK